MLSYTKFINELKISELSDLADPKRKRKSKNVSIEYIGIKEKRGVTTFVFSALDVEGKSQRPKQVFLQFAGLAKREKFNKIFDSEDNFQDALKNNDIKIHCNCRDFKFQGYKYMGSPNVMNYGIYKEKRPPDIKNPYLEGSLCKHCLAVIENIDAYYDIIIDKMFNKKKGK